MNSIAIYSDLICPWCYIGKRRMEEALRQLPPGTDVSRSWHPFPLNPDMPTEKKPTSAGPNDGAQACGTDGCEIPR